MGEIIRGVSHVDRALAPDWMSTPFEKTPEGFLKGRAIVTSTGVFPYQDATGKVQRELRLPEEVFHPNHMDSLKLKPITNDHPPELVTPENIKKYQVGHLGASPDGSDLHHLSIDMVVTDADAIAAVQAGKRALSCRYDCDLERADEGAKHEGMAYDYIQRNLRANHVAIVDQARAGDSARIRLDSADMVLIEDREDGVEKTALGTPRFDVARQIGGGIEITSPELDSDRYRGEMIQRMGMSAPIRDEDIDVRRARADAARAALPEPVFDPSSDRCDSAAYRRSMIAQMKMLSRAPTGARRDNRAHWMDGLNTATAAGGTRLDGVESFPAVTLQTDGGAA